MQWHHKTASSWLTLSSWTVHKLHISNSINEPRYKWEKDAWRIIRVNQKEWKRNQSWNIFHSILVLSSRMFEIAEYRVLEQCLISFKRISSNFPLLSDAGKWGHTTSTALREALNIKRFPRTGGNQNLKKIFGANTVIWATFQIQSSLQKGSLSVTGV
jgi:hypothetical protein